MGQASSTATVCGTPRKSGATLTGEAMVAFEKEPPPRPAGATASVSIWKTAAQARTYFSNSVTTVFGACYVADLRRHVDAAYAGAMSDVHVTSVRTRRLPVAALADDSAALETQISLGRQAKTRISFVVMRKGRSAVVLGFNGLSKRRQIELARLLASRMSSG